MENHENPFLFPKGAALLSSDGAGYPSCAELCGRGRQCLWGCPPGLGLAPHWHLEWLLIRTGVFPRRLLPGSWQGSLRPCRLGWHSGLCCHQPSCRNCPRERRCLQPHFPMGPRQPVLLHKDIRTVNFRKWEKQAQIKKKKKANLQISIFLNEWHIHKVQSWKGTESYMQLNFPPSRFLQPSNGHPWRNLTAYLNVSVVLGLCFSWTFLLTPSKEHSFHPAPPPLAPRT